MAESRLYLGDCLEVMKNIPDNSVDMILCDLPYGITASKWDKNINAARLWGEYKRILKNTGSAVLFASGQFAPRVMLSNLDWYKYSWIWVKKNSTNFVHAKNRPMTLHEQILVFSPAPMGHASQLGDKRMTYNPQGLIPCKQIKKQGKARFGTIAGNRPSHLKEDESFIREYTNYPCDVLTDFADLPPNKKMHTNEKPVALLEYLIKTYTNEGNVVLDNCMGSGSTGVAALNCDCCFIGIELDEKYFTIAKNRIQECNNSKEMQQ